MAYVVEVSNGEMSGRRRLQESEVRTLRDAIYGPISDREWENVKINWAKDADWLVANQPKRKD